MEDLQMKLPFTFVDPSESAVATLQNGALQNIVSGEGYQDEDAVVTQKRLYYRRKKGILNITHEEDVIDLNDITATKIIARNPYSLLVIAGVLFLFALIGFAGYSRMGNGSISAAFLVGTLVYVLYFVVLFFVLKKKYLLVEYAGGRIFFTVKKYRMENVRSFQQAIYKMKHAEPETKTED